MDESHLMRYRYMHEFQYPYFTDEIPLGIFKAPHQRKSDQENIFAISSEASRRSEGSLALLHFAPYISWTHSRL